MSSIKNMTQSAHFKKWAIISFLLMSLFGWCGMTLYGHYYVSTDNAYVNANIVQIAPRVTGKVNALYVRNNQYVSKDQMLFIIDPEPMELAVNSARAALSVSLTELDNTLRTKDRVMQLVRKKFLSRQDGDNVEANYKTAVAKVEQAKAQLAQTELNLSYTLIKTPSSGWVTNMSLREGDILAANQPMFALISDQEFWIDANFKETELEAIHPGQKAEIVSDMYPHHTFHGVVESISGGAGSAFSLLPPQNATGNWVKVTQRVPVRIRVLDANKKFPLRIGTSVAVKIHLQTVRKKLA